MDDSTAERLTYEQAAERHVSAAAVRARAMRGDSREMTAKQGC
jgi:hypothetical protein